MKKTVGLLLAVALLAAISGCVRRMKHPTKPPSEWAVDHKACEKEAREFMNERPDNIDYGFEMKLIKNCMKEKGWYK